MFQVIDTLSQDLVVQTFPTFRKAFNAARRVEETPEGRKLGYVAQDGTTHDWRYQIRRQPKLLALARAYSMGEVKIGQMAGAYPA